MQNKSNGWLPYVVGITIGLAVVCAAGFAVFAMFFYKPAVPKIPVETTPPAVVKFVTAAPTDAPPAQPQTVPAATATPLPTVHTTKPPESPAQPVPLAATATPVPAPATQPAPAGLTPMASPDYGIQAFLYWRPEVADRDLGLIKDAGFRWVKQEFAWREIEGAGKGQFDWSRTDRMMDQITQRELKVIARVGVQPAWAGGNYPDVSPPDNYQDYADFVFAVASRYKGRIQAYQIWNEPNLAREWGNRPPSPAEYTQLLKVAYQAIKKADPNAIVITAGLAPTTRNDDVAMPDMYFIQGLYDAGAKPYFDMLGVNAAGYRAPPEMDPGEVARDPNYANPGDFQAGTPEDLRRIYCFRHVEDVRQLMVNNNDADKRIAIMEFGWTTDDRPNSPYNWFHVSEQTQGDYIVRAYQYAKENWQPWIGVMSLIYMPDADWTSDDEQWYWSIVVPRWPDAWPRPAYHMIKAMPK